MVWKMALAEYLQWNIRNCHAQLKILILNVCLSLNNNYCMWSDILNIDEDH